MSISSGTIPPPVSWAQRNDLLYIIIDVECSDIEHKVTENTFNFKGINVLDPSKKYDVTLNFLNPVNPEKVTSKNIGRCLEFTIYKKESGAFWPTLTSDKTKLHFLKANFAKWMDDEDDEDDEYRPPSPMSAMTGFDKFSDFDLDDEDSDDNIPSLSQNDEDEEEGKDKEEEKN